MPIRRQNFTAFTVNPTGPVTARTQVENIRLYRKDLTDSQIRKGSVFTAWRLICKISHQLREHCYQKKQDGKEYLYRPFETITDENNIKHIYETCGINSETKEDVTRCLGHIIASDFGHLKQAEVPTGQQNDSLACIQACVGPLEVSLLSNESTLFDFRTVISQYLKPAVRSTEFPDETIVEFEKRPQPWLVAIALTVLKEDYRIKVYNSITARKNRERRKRESDSDDSRDVKRRRKTKEEKRRYVPQTSPVSESSPSYSSSSEKQQRSSTSSSEQLSPTQFVPPVDESETQRAIDGILLSNPDNNIADNILSISEGTSPESDCSYFLDGNILDLSGGTFSLQEWSDDLDKLLSQINTTTAGEQPNNEQTTRQMGSEDIQQQSEQNETENSTSERETNNNITGVLQRTGSEEEEQMKEEDSRTITDNDAQEKDESGNEENSEMEDEGEVEKEEMEESEEESAKESEEESDEEEESAKDSDEEEGAKEESDEESEEEGAKESDDDNEEEGAKESEEENQEDENQEVESEEENHVEESEQESHDEDESEEEEENDMEKEEENDESEKEEEENDADHPTEETTEEVSQNDENNTSGDTGNDNNNSTSIVISDSEGEEETDVVKVKIEPPEETLEIGIRFQTYNEIVLNNEDDFVKHYRRHRPTDKTNAAVINLYKYCVDVYGGKSAKLCSKFFLRTKGAISKVQKEIEKRIHGARTPEVYHAICHYLVPSVSEGKIPLPVNGWRNSDRPLVDRNDTIVENVQKKTLSFSNPHILSLLLATVFDETAHLSCVNYVSMSRVEFAFEQLQPQSAYNNNSAHVMRFLDDSVVPKSLVNRIATFDHNEVECTQRLANFLLKQCSVRKEELKDIPHPDRLQRERMCCICHVERTDLLRYACCNASLCFACHAQSMNKASEREDDWALWGEERRILKCCGCNTLVKCVMPVEWNEKQ